MIVPDGWLEGLPDSVASSLGPMGLLFAHGLIHAVDDAGNAPGRPSLLGALCLQYLPANPEQVEAWIDALEGVGIVQRYDAQGASYIHVPALYSANRGREHFRLRYPLPPWLAVQQAGRKRRVAPLSKETGTVLANSQNSSGEFAETFGSEKKRSEENMSSSLRAEPPSPPAPTDRPSADDDDLLAIRRELEARTPDVLRHDGQRIAALLREADLDTVIAGIRRAAERSRNPPQRLDYVLRAVREEAAERRESKPPPPSDVRLEACPECGGESDGFCQRCGGAGRIAVIYRRREAMA
jgi:hypothetical protein